MKALKQSLAIFLVAGMSSVNAAESAQCEGTSARLYETPAKVFEGADGTITFHMQSTGVSHIVRPTASDAWQHCTGLWTLGPDKSGSGFGTCLSIDKDGDHERLAFKGTNDPGKPSAGTWEITMGTGKFKTAIGLSGTWEAGSKFAGGFRTGRWAGECVAG